MTAVQKKLLGILLCVALTLLAGIVLFASCKRAEDLKVTYMVQDEGSSEWKQFGETNVEKGETELPTVTKKYYTFANWYENKDFTGTPFTGKNITKSMTVYARFIPVEVNVHINGIDKGKQNLVDVVEGKYNPGEGLEFDGWYTNANYTTKWDNKIVTNDLYAKSVARITFNDGYKDVYTTTVNPGAIYENPATQEIETDGVVSTVQKAHIWQNYMSARDISYVDEKGKIFDFTQPINKNTVITVRWRSPFLRYQTNPTTNKLSVTMYGTEGKYDDTENVANISEVPVISILGTITFDKDGDGIEETYEVESVRPEQDIFKLASSIEKMIIGEGIESVQSLIASGASNVEEIVLPSTLKVIQNCFNNLNKLKGISIPDGVEVIIGSFWANTVASYNGYGQYNNGEQYSFDIAIPNSVKNLSMVPNNLTFGQNKENAKAGNFYKEGSYIYKIDDLEGHIGDLLLVSDTTKETLSVPEGVKGIQVGTYFNRTLEYLTLPSTFSYVRYNEDISDYPAAAFQYSTKSFLFDKQYANDLKGHVPPTGYAIFNAMEKIKLLNFRQANYPENLLPSTFIGDPTGWAAYGEEMYEYCDSTSLKDKVVYTGESDNPVVNINYLNKLTNENHQATLDKNKGDSIAVEELLDAIDKKNGTTLKSDYESKKLGIVSVKNMGIEYNLSDKLNSNVYLDVTFNYIADGGYNAEDNGDGTATITGFNEDTSYAAYDGLNTVVVPENVNIGGKNLKVTKIAPNAFNNNASIGYVILPSTLKEIGEKAFYNCAALKAVDISACKLEKIGISAFEGSAITTITLALSDMKEIGAYAFKVKTLKYFNVVKGEENRKMMNKSDLKEGEFFFSYGTIYEATTTYEAAVGIYQYVKKSITGEGESAATVWDVKFVASAGGYNSSEGSQINLGDISIEKNIIRYEVMNGSYYFFSYDTTLHFNCVLKIHRKAFTDCNKTSLSEIFYSSKYMGCSITGRKKLSELVNDDKCVGMFEEEWYEGYTDSGFGQHTIKEIE